MAWSDRVKETSNTGGTGVLTLNGAVLGYQAFQQNFSNNTVIEGYVIEAIDVNGSPTGNWESGVGLFTTNSTSNNLTRSLVLSNNLGTQSPISFAASNCYVYCVPSACTNIYLNYGEVGAL